LTSLPNARRPSHGWDTASERWLKGSPCGGLLPPGLGREILSALASPTATRPCSRQATRGKASAAWTPSPPPRHAFCPRLGTPSSPRRRHALVTRTAGQIQAVERSAVSGAAGAWFGAVRLGVCMGVPTRVGSLKGMWVPGGTHACPWDFRARGASRRRITPRSPRVSLRISCVKNPRVDKEHIEDKTSAGQHIRAGLST
jgi:hypothetical protein